MRALLLRIGADAYAVRMEQAREVVADPVVTPLPTAPRSVLGVCNVRGEIVPVFDTATLLGFGAMTSWSAMAIVDTPLGIAGLVTSSTGEAIDLGDEVAPSDGPGTVGAFAMGDGEVAVLVDVEVLLSPARIGS